MTIPQALQIAIQRHQAGRLADAEALYRQILAVQPNHADALHLLGVIAHQVGRHDHAAELIRQAIVLDPNNPIAHSNLGEACRSAGQLDEAMAAYRRALQVKPDLPEAHNNLGSALAAQDLLDDAIAAFRRALQLKPGYPEAQNNLGLVLWDRDRCDEAVAAFRRALELKPDYREAHNNLGNALKNLGELDEAIAAFRLALQPGREDPGIHSNLIYTLHFHPGHDSRSICAERQRWNRQFCDPQKQFVRPPTNDRDSERPLRIGYVSPDFRDHVVGRNLLPLFECHDRRNFEVLCYSGVLRPDKLTEEFRERAQHWRSTVGVGDAALADIIRRDGVDILVDLTQHMAGNRLPMFARQPAPIQVSFAGYPESTGLDAIEYRISDRYLEAVSEPGMHFFAATPNGGNANGVKIILPKVGRLGPTLGNFGKIPCAESVETSKMHDTLSAAKSPGQPERVWLIDSFWCYDPRGLQVEVNGLPARESRRMTFGCLGNFRKTNERVLTLWARVLRSITHSRLLIGSPSGSPRQRTLEVLRREGVEDHRVEFVEHRPRREYLELYHRLDILLDTFPYNGHTTSLDALWMGVPVVSLAGDTPVSRAGLSQLTNLGLPELVAHSEEDYVRIAVGLAADLPRLAQLRSALRERMEKSVLMNAQHFARQVEQAYREMWQRWSHEQSPTRKQ